MRYTSNYNFSIAEGTDGVNLLTQSYPNFETIDTALKEVSDSAITSAAETKVGTVHNLVRTSPDRTVIKFTATSNFVTGDTFTVDGVAVTAVTTGGTALKTGAFLINSNVLCILNGLVLTVLVSEVSVDASDVNFDNAGTGMLSTNVQDAIEEVKNAIPTVPSNYAATAITYDNTGSGLVATNAQDAIDELAAQIPGGYVEIVADGVKTTPTLLNELFNLLDVNKIRLDSKFVLYSTAGEVLVFKLRKYKTDGSMYDFSNDAVGATQGAINLMLLTNNASHYYSVYINVGNDTFGEVLSAQPNGTVLRVYY